MSAFLYGARLSAAAAIALAGTFGAAAAETSRTPACAMAAGRAAGLAMAPGADSLAGLAMTFTAGRENSLALGHVASLQGPCADEVLAFRMDLVFFTDGQVFSVSPDGRFAPVPGTKGLANFGGKPLSTAHPPMGQARFIMAANVMSATVGGEARSLDVGLWQEGDAWIVAAFTQHGGSFDRPVELLRSTRPIRSVTYFPSPDSPSGTLGLVLTGDAEITLAGIDWAHRALSMGLLSME